MPLLTESRNTAFRTTKRGRIIDTTTSTADSGWQRIEGLFPATLTVGGTASSLTWQVYTTNYMDTPSAVHEATWGPAQTGFHSVEISGPYEHVKVKFTTVSGGNAFCDMRAG